MPRRRSKRHTFGGPWTERKLTVIAKYLAAYSKALENKPRADSPFRRVYVDGFAGSGSRAERTAAGLHLLNEDLFSGSSEAEPRRAFLDGSARIALQVSPAFHQYVFIDRSIERCNQLEALKGEYPTLASRIDIRTGDANVEIRALCAGNWSGSRSVMFLDPYGMQVEWATIEAIARTAAIDLWLLFPLGMAVNRVLTRSGEIPESWRRRLDLLLGDQTWYEEFYHVEPALDLFGSESEHVSKMTLEVIGTRFVDRLCTLFPGVVESPGVLRNSTGNPLFLLCFAAANKSGAPVALKIAASLLKGLR